MESSGTWPKVMRLPPVTREAQWCAIPRWPAQFMGLDHRLGSIAVGKAASMVLVRSDPLQDVRNAQ